MPQHSVHWASSETEVYIDCQKPVVIKYICQFNIEVLQGPEEENLYMGDLVLVLTLLILVQMRRQPSALETVGRFAVIYREL